MNNKPKTVVLYASAIAQSPSKEGPARASIQKQLKALREYAKQKGHTILKEYQDIKYSPKGHSSDLEQLAVDSFDSNFQAVLVPALNKISTEYFYFRTIKDHLEGNKVSIYALDYDLE